MNCQTLATFCTEQEIQRLYKQWLVQNVNISRTKLPIGSVHCKPIGWLVRKQWKYKACNQFCIQHIFRFNRWILRRDESVFTSESKQQASFSNLTVWTLHKALINKPKNLIRARFILLSNASARISDKIVLLFLALIFIVDNCCDKQFQIIEYQCFM